MLDSFLSFFVDFGVELTLAQLIYCLRLPKRKVFWARLAAWLVLCAVFPFATNFYQQELFGFSLFNASFVLLFIISVLCVFMTFKINFITALYYGLSGYITQHCAHKVSMLCVSLFPIVDTTLSTFIRILFIFGVYILFWFLFARRIGKTVPVYINRVSLLLVSLIGVATIYALNLFATESVGSNNIVTSLYAIAVSVLLLLLQFGIFRQGDLQDENTKMELLLESQARQKDVMKDSIDVINMRCHDMKKQLNQLSEEEIEESEVLKKLKQAISKYEETVEAGNETINIVLTEKLFQSEKYGVKLSYMVDGEKLNFLPPIDVYNMFVNILDNALEAVIKESADKRIISLKVQENNGFLCINEENYCAAPLKVEGDEVRTTKVDGRFHGFGLKSIRYIVEKYGGNLVVGQEGELFSLKAIIPLPM